MLPASGPASIIRAAAPEGMMSTPLVWTGFRPARKPRILRARRGASHTEIAVATGTVKWFNGTKGYGFIQPQDGGKDVFVHISAVERAGLTGLAEGQRVEYELVSNRGKQSAENLKVQR
jgi:CspA family cold shock protein